MNPRDSNTGWAVAGPLLKPYDSLGVLDYLGGIYIGTKWAKHTPSSYYQLIQIILNTLK